MLKNTPVTWKLWLVIGVTSLFGIAALLVGTSLLQSNTEDSVRNLAETRLEGHKGSLKNVVDIALSTWSVGLQDCADQDEKVDYLRRMNAPVRFLDNKTGYIFIYEVGGTVAVHPAKPELEGKNQWGLEDADGVPFIQELDKTARNGGGFVHYRYPKPGSDEPQPKLSYTAMIPGTNLWAGTGVYIDDVAAESAQVRAQVMARVRKVGLLALVGMALFFGLGVFPLALYVSRLIISPLKEISAMADELSKGQVDRTVTYEAGDELGKTAAAFRHLVQVLRERSEVALQIANGDLTREVKVYSQRDLLGTAIQRMSSNLNELLLQISEASDRVNSSSGQISETAQALSQGAIKNAANLQEISASLTEVADQTNTNASDAGNANSLAEQARGSAEEGSVRVGEMVEAMNEINESSQAITRVIKAIDDIAFKTNLLALNAAVEAARAGAHGKGFAVVAEEVRTLAGQSAKAARESAGLLEASQARVEKGTQIADVTSASLVEILDNSTQVAGLLGNIASASQQQASALAEINESLQEIDNVTQQNSAHAEETAAGTQEMAAQASGLKQLVSRFTFRGKAARQHEHRHHPVDAGPIQPTVDELEPADLVEVGWPD